MESRGAYSEQAEVAIERLIKKGKRKFILYPFGENGKMVKAILDVYFDIHDYVIVDNFLSRKYVSIKSLADLSAGDLKDATVLITTDREDIYDELRKPLFEAVSKESCVELFPVRHEAGEKITRGLHFMTSDYRINYFNWYTVPKSGNGDDVWLTRFIKSYVADSKIFNIFNMFGDDSLVRNVNFERKIFYTPEELLIRDQKSYSDYCLNAVDLAIGTAYISDPKYLRIPYWVTRYFDPVMDRTVIENRISDINAAKSTGKWDCVLINSHDQWHTREPIYDGLKDIVDIRCAGRWNQNTKDLKNIYYDNKKKYVHEFRFNICPENVNSPGYVSEKLFDAFDAGSIPIYYGSDNKPEPGVINPNAVLFWEIGGDNTDLINEVRRLRTDEIYYQHFMEQEKLFLKPATEWIYSKFEELAQRLNEM